MDEESEYRDFESLAQGHIVQMLTLPGQWDRNYWGSGSKLLQNESVPMDTTVKYIRELLEFSEEFGISDFENSCNTAKQISTGLEWKLNLKILILDESFR